MFKNIIFASALTLIMFSCKEEVKKSDEITSSDVSIAATASGEKKGDLPEITFEETEHDFGRITQGEKVSYAFKFKNSGKSNLLISSAAGSCGCTVPEWPKQPILPGQEGKINVVFNSEGKSGLQEKSITIVTNCEPSTKLVRIKTNIIVPEKAEE